MTTELEPRSNSRQLAPSDLPALSRSFSRVIAGSGTLCIGGVAAIVFFGASWLSVATVVIGAVVFIVASVSRRLARGAGTALSATRPEEPLERKELRRRISKAKYFENVGDLGERIATQLDQASQRMRRLDELLSQKFAPGEITRDRFKAAADQAYLAVLDQLSQAEAFLAGAEAIVAKPIEAQLHELESARNERSSDTGALASTLKERLALREKQLGEARVRLAFTEGAVTSLDRVSAALSEVQTQRGEASVSLDQAMAQLAELAERARHYSVTSK